MLSEDPTGQAMDAVRKIKEVRTSSGHRAGRETWGGSLERLHGHGEGDVVGALSLLGCSMQSIQRPNMVVPATYP